MNSLPEWDNKGKGMEKEVHGRNEEFSPGAKVKLVPKDKEARKEAILGFMEFASAMKNLREEKKEVPAGILLRHFLREHKDWFYTGISKFKIVR